MKELRKKRIRQLALWTFAWVLTLQLTQYGSSNIWEENTLITISAILLNLGLGIGMIMVNRKFLNESDELQRKIQLESMGITLGLTLVGGITLTLLDHTELIPFRAEISTLITFMGLTYITSTLINSRKYR